MTADVSIKAPLFLITGTPGAGKSTVATALMQRFDFGLHIPVDSLREWVVSGIAHPVPTWTEETTRQFDLARASAVHVASLYLQAGFAVAIDDVIGRQEAEEVLAPLAGFPVHKVLLHPSAEIALKRNAERTNKAFDTSVLAETSRALHAWVSRQDYQKAGWLVVDSSSMTVDETVDTILRKSTDPQST